MFGINLDEILLIAIIALIVLGPKQLTQITKFIGRATYKIKNFYFNIKQDVYSIYDNHSHPIIVNNANLAHLETPGEVAPAYLKFYQPELELNSNKPPELFETL